MTVQPAVPRQTIDTYLPANQLGIRHQTWRDRMGARTAAEAEALMWLAKVSACTRGLGRRAALLIGWNPGLRGTLATWLTTPHGTGPSTTL